MPVCVLHGCGYLSSLYNTAPRLVSATTNRESSTTLNVTVNVVYTGSGGGGLSLVNLRVRELGASDNSWIQLGFGANLIPSSFFVGIWSTLVTSQQIAMLMNVELSFTIENSASRGITLNMVQQSCT